MAAGMGSRYGGLKQIESFGPNNELIIDYSIYDAIRVGFDKVIFIIKEENYELFKEKIGDRISKYIKVEYAFQKLDDVLKGYNIPSERIKPLGTAHAIYSARDLIDSDFAVINADDFYGLDAFKKVKEYMDQVEVDSYHFAMAGYIVKNTLSENGKVKRGICKEENTYLKKIIESNIGYEGDTLIATRLMDDVKFEVEADDLVSMNFFGFTPSIFSHLEKNFHVFLEKNKNNISKCEYLIPDVVQELIDEKISDMKVLKTTAKWHGVTYKEDKEALQEAIKNLIEEKVYPSHLWKKKS